ncbi:MULTISPECIES: SGNH/GDSL hydrolase family protein [Cryobacterium]|uniref:SGNH/GDSL hydrolase family protein n=1 Tax=Cryobacterium breve TaxID=1259258 RepID=A0ABY2J0T8_9MICO|nr:MULTISPECIES: SGNH/GDSL hydrolase family protein [Cryobacterium]TFC94232.1 SGNH/GDSL hydrolase family protein [Cryobacterium sp. TmT3-12]TFC98557.1 SGNH/GDSL hydrolase family protein [Cryobacterium breve]
MTARLRIRLRWWKYPVVAVLAVGALGLALLALQPVGPEGSGAPKTPYPTIAPAPRAPTAVFLGGPTTAGAGASGPATRWSTVLAAAKGWQEISLATQGGDIVFGVTPDNCGSSSCPSYQELVARTVELNPSVVVLAAEMGGKNVISPDAVATTNAVFAALRVGLPDATLIVVGPAAPTGLDDARAVELDSAVRAAAARVGASFVSLLEPKVLDPSLVAGDGVSVNEAGHAAIAARVTTALS